ncbi:MAG: magnesium/cobalt transporter CorA [Bacteroidota bacterium]
MAKRNKLGLVPGSVVYTGNQQVEKVLMHYLQYDEQHIEEHVFDSHQDATLHESADEEVDWYDLRGLHDTELLKVIGKQFTIHPLVMEDVADIYQRPKFEEYENGIFVIIRALYFDKTKVEIKTEQVAIFFNRGLLLSFQETDSDLFEEVRHRLQTGRGRIRKRGADYLCYALLDNIVDHYYVVFEEVEEVIENLEEQLLDQPDSSMKQRIHQLKKELLTARKSISPLREAVSRFSKSENELIQDNTTVFTRDLYDHTIQIMDMVESYRDMLNGLQDLYLSEISFRMNQVMQVLTIITTIFVPLSFLAGLYGMNFEHIPELHYRYGYFVLLSVMLLIAIGLLLFFRRKGWF